MFVSFAGSAFAADDNTVHYTDLFYGYTPDYLRSNYISEYVRENRNVIDDICVKFSNSDEEMYLEFKTGIEITLKPKDSFKWWMDYLGITNFMYNDSLDAANIMFAEAMFDISSEDYGGIGTLGNLIKQEKEGINLLNTFFEAYNQDLIDDDNFKAMQAAVLEEQNNGFLEKLTVADIQTILSYEIINDFSKKLGTAATVVEVVQAVMTALIMENVRIEMIDAILKYTDEGTPLNDGMKRLRLQLCDDFESYFITTYGLDTALEKLVKTVKKIYETEKVGGLIADYNIATFLYKIASFITFDLSLKVPDIDDVYTQRMLSLYITQLYQALNSSAVNKYGKEEKVYSPVDVAAYENIFTALLASVKAGLKSSEPIAGAYMDKIQTVRENYSDFSYEAYITDITNTISGIPLEQRMVRNDITYSLNLPVKFSEPSDFWENDKMYIFNGGINANIILCGNGTVTSEIDNLVINGNVTANAMTLENVNVKINGDLTIYNCLEFSNGQLAVCGDCTLGDRSIRGYNGILKMTHSDDYLLVDGDITVCGYRGDTADPGYLTDGIVEIKGNFTECGKYLNYYYYGTLNHKTVFSGNKMQIVHIDHPERNKFGNLYLENTNINFETAINEFTLNQNTRLPHTEKLEVLNTLDLNGYSLETPAEVTAGTLVTNGGTFNVSSATIKNAMVSGGKSNVNGDLTVYNCLEFSNGQLAVCGDCTLGDRSITGYNGDLKMTHSDDYLLVGGNFISQGDSGKKDSQITDGVLELKGDFTVAVSYEKYAEKENHRTVFSGGANQSVSINNPTYGVYNYLNNVACFRGTPVQQYCEENGVEYTLLDIGGTFNTNVDYANKVVFTTVRGTTDTGAIVTKGDQTVINTAPSNENGYLGTGSLLTVYENEVFTGDYTVIVGGDLDGDSVCDVLDIVIAERAASDKYTPTAEQIYAANGYMAEAIDTSSYQTVVNSALAA